MNRRVTAVLLAFLTASAMLVLQAGTAAADTTYTPSPWNGKKVYLSPSSQSANVGCDGYNEKDGARAIATKVKDYLFARRYAVRIGSGTSAENVTSSNAWGSSVHVPIHSNATTFNCTAPFNPAKGGTWLLYKPNSSAGMSLSQKIYDTLRGQSPGTLDRIGTDVDLTGGTAFHELRATNMASAYVEAAFHTYRPDVDWLRNPATVGNLIGAGIDNYFGNPRCPPCPLRDPGTTGVALAEPVPPQSTTGQDYPDAVKSVTLEDAIEQLASGSTGARLFGDSTSGLAADVRVTPQGLAVVDIRGLSTSVPAGAPSAVIRDFITGLNDTVFADPSVIAIEYRSDGSCAAFWAWFDAECQRVQRPQLRG